MAKFWDRLFPLDCELSMWVEEDDLGTEKLVTCHGRDIYVTIPKTINQKISLRLREFNKTRSGRAGDLLLHLWLNKGRDIRKNLWLSESSAKHGCDKILTIHGERKAIVVPPKSRAGLTIRLNGLGAGPPEDALAPDLENKARGNLLVRLCVYPDRVTPRYTPFDSLSTDDMVLEGWVYRKYDELLQKIGGPSIHIPAVQIETITDVYNEHGCQGIFAALVAHLQLAHLGVDLMKSPIIDKPGNCVMWQETQPEPAVKNSNRIVNRYRVTINDQFLDNPFLTTAILAHELCHVFYAEKIVRSINPFGFDEYSGKARLELERSVDLLVFLFKIGEFQLRSSHDLRLVIGYFNPEIFERMQVIVQRKMDGGQRG